MPNITPNLWMDTQGEEAAEFYCSIFPNSKITNVGYYTEAGPGPAGTAVTVEFVLDGNPFVIINGGPAFTLSEAVSFEIACDDQEEVDYYWSKLLEGGGEESQCGWLKDRYGLSWQVVPKRFVEIMNDPDPEKVKRATEAMFTMQKLDVAKLEAAVAGA